MADRISWKYVINPLILKTLAEQPRWRFPTIRGMFYFLSDGLKVIPRTESMYRKVDKVIVDMRKSGALEFGRFSVMRGVSGTNGGIALDPPSHAEFYIQLLIDMAESYNMPYLYGQPYVYEIWVEKKGLLGTFEALTQHLDIKVRCTEGYSPWEFCYESVNDIKEHYTDRQQEHVHIDFYSDADPSGLQIVRSVNEQLAYFLGSYAVKRRGVLPEQIRRNGLPESPKDAGALQRITNDPNLKKYIAKYGKVFCELDSFISLAPDDFKSVLLDNASTHIDALAVEQCKETAAAVKSGINDVLHSREPQLRKLQKEITKELEDRDLLEPWWKA